MPAEAPAQTAKQESTGLVRGLSAWDGVLLVIGGVIGSALFLVPKEIAAALPSPPLFLGVWVAGGVLALMGALVFAELGAMFPEAGGQYVYLREAYGDFAAFLYGWLMFVAGTLLFPPRRSNHGTTRTYVPSSRPRVLCACVSSSWSPTFATVL